MVSGAWIRIKGDAGTGVAGRFRSCDHRPMKVTRDGDTFTLRGQHWHETFPLEQLPKQLAFYRSMQANFPKASGRYDETVEGLEALATEVGLRA